MKFKQDRHQSGTSEGYMLGCFELVLLQRYVSSLRVSIRAALLRVKPFKCNLLHARTSHNLFPDKHAEALYNHSSLISIRVGTVSGVSSCHLGVTFG